MRKYALPEKAGFEEVGRKKVDFEKLKFEVKILKRKIKRAIKKL